MEDIAPELLEKIRADFQKNIDKNPLAAELLKQIKADKATYTHAGEYAHEIGAALADAFGANLSSAVLPDGKMYYNIAEKVIGPMLGDDHALVSDAAVQVQQALNTAAGVGIKAQTAPLDTERVQGILNKVSSAPQYDDVAWVLDEPIKTFSQAIADDTLKANVEFQGKAGLHPKVIRKAEHKCCEWCSRLEGEYTYPDVPKDVYRRHANCRCDVNYDPGSGKWQNVWTKQWAEPKEVAAREARKQFSMQNELVKYASVRYNQDGTVIVTDDWKNQKRVSVPSHYAPNAVVETQTAYRDGTIQINRTFYDDSGWMKLQVHSGNHERPHTHRFGTDGSEPCHKHLYKRTESGVVRDGKAVSLTAEDKTRNRDILQEVKK